MGLRTWLAERQQEGKHKPGCSRVVFRDDPGSGLTSESKVKASHASGPEVRPWLAQWYDSRETQSMPELPVQTKKWLPACWCLIVCSCWFCSLTTRGIEAFFITYKSLCNLSCQRLGLRQSAAHIFPQYPYAWTYRGMMARKWCTAVQPLPWPG